MKSYLLLESGECLEGENIGYFANTSGELVFTTSMTGYVESLTDPSFANQILVFTYPLIGNYGVPSPIFLDKYLLKNFESLKIWVKGIVVSEISGHPYHYQMQQTMSQWLKKHKIPAITQIDTRALTQKIRDRGVMKAIISNRKIKFNYKNETVDLISQVCLNKIVEYNLQKNNGKHIAVIDCGIKHGIIRALINAGYQVTRVPYNVNPLDITHKIDGVVVSNGPGDPKNCSPEIFTNIRKILQAKIPFLGICLGHQLLALAIGADTYKLKYGHRGLNQPVLDVLSNKAYVTSQNHGYAVKTNTLPTKYKEWFKNLNDGTNEGIINTQQKVWSTQFHPEGCPGPFDTDWIFKIFMSL